MNVLSSESSKLSRNQYLEICYQNPDYDLLFRVTRWIDRWVEPSEIIQVVSWTEVAKCIGICKQYLKYQLKKLSEQKFVKVDFQNRIIQIVLYSALKDEFSKLKNSKSSNWQFFKPEKKESIWKSTRSAVQDPEQGIFKKQKTKVINRVINLLPNNLINYSSIKKNISRILDCNDRKILDPSINKDCLVINLLPDLLFFYFDEIKKEYTLNSKSAYLESLNVKEKNLHSDYAKVFDCFELCFFKKFKKQIKVNRNYPAHISVAKKVADKIAKYQTGGYECNKISIEQYVVFAFNFFYAMSRSNGNGKVYFTSLGSDSLEELFLNRHEILDPENFDYNFGTHQEQIETNQFCFRGYWIRLMDCMKKEGITKHEISMERYYNDCVKLGWLRDVPYKEVIEGLKV